ncbi:MAG: amidohydrolase [Thermomicrobiales bacterium]|nr:amidohydrolase [Thermomicrobiales bacterium]
MSVALPALQREAEEILPGVIADRRFLHENPELSFQEYETAKFVAERLRAIGLDEVQTGVAETGVVGLLHGHKPGKTVLLRADMDALPIDEANDVPYKSTKPGVMHACGHDAHTAILLGVARVLASKRDAFAGTVKFIFQPAEEGLGGAKAMVEAGVLENPHVDGVFGLHVAQWVPTGIVQARDNTAMMGANQLSIKIQGRGGHGAQPHLTIDPIAVGCAIVTSMQTVISRTNDPIAAGVLTIGAFNAGSAANVIPDTAQLEGGIRSVTVEQRDALIQRATEIAIGVGRGMGAEVTVDTSRGVSPTVNDPEMAALVREVAAEMIPADRVVQGELVAGSEDFSEFLNERPGAFFLVGTRSEEKGFVGSHHNPSFDIDEEPMSIGISVLAGTAMRFLERD